MRAEAVVEEIVAACRSMEGLPYDGEPVDQLQHALQCAHLARSAAAEREVVVAALLHDIARAPAVAGVVYDDAAAAAEHHGTTGARWLTPRVGVRVAWLAESHVPAKLYLVATDPDYVSRLSPVSAQTLVAQGGGMSDHEVKAFRSHPDWRAAVQLRRWDDLAKDPRARVPGLQAYAEDLLAVALAGP